MPGQQAAIQYNCDINLDKRVDAADYQALLVCVQNTQTCQGVRKYASDLNGDNSVDEKDINYFLTTCKKGQ